MNQTPDLPTLIKKWLKEKLIRESIDVTIFDEFLLKQFLASIICWECMSDLGLICADHVRMSDVKLYANSPGFFDKLEKELSGHSCLPNKATEDE